ncbi:hypothetical protein OESDEN_01783 [Oesophagostomum dentatum]|uniref:PID domain-containing protein n=1 Tax=Oesophagostomum dentatum TaxID=61180 RepID=A0A0B1TQ59_OESDE|nr:hypothetical protein OESDEN_01783 [Oesophagostomum dentatum]
MQQCCEYSKLNPQCETNSNRSKFAGDTKVRFFERFSNYNSTSHEFYRSNEENVVDQIESAQLDGILPVQANDRQKVNVRVSKHGAWISRNMDSTTVDRIPLVNIVFSLAYDDGFNRYNVAMVVKARQSEPEYKCHVFQCNSLREADEFLKKIDHLFNSVVDTIERREAEECEWVDV